MHLGAEILLTSHSGKAKYPVVDAQRFLRLTAQHFPLGTLVVGWQIDPKLARRYDWNTVMNMYTLLVSRDVRQSISLSIHALLCRESIPMIKWLSEMLDASITVISAPQDKVNPNDFLFLRNKFDKSIVYYDMHHSNVADSDVEKPQQVAANLQKLQHLRFRTEQWKIAPSEFEQTVLMTSEAVVMQRGCLVYTEDPYVFTNEPMIIRGRLTMFGIPDDKAIRRDVGITISLHESAEPLPYSMDGIRCFIGADGMLKISTRFHKDNDLVPLTAADFNAQKSGCYLFEIRELVGQSVTMSVQHAVDCDTASYYDAFPTSNSTIKLDVSGIEYEQKHIAISSSNTFGYVAIEIFKAN